MEDKIVLFVLAMFPPPPVFRDKNADREFIVNYVFAVYLTGSLYAFWIVLKDQTVTHIGYLKNLVFQV